MFTLEQINDLHDRFGRAETLAAYLRGLRAIGVVRVDSYLVDGHAEFFGGGHSVVSPPAHQHLAVAETGDREECLRHLTLHEQGKTSYVEMSEGLARSGIDKWTMDTGTLTLTYYDKAGNEMLAERIE
jgi:uncharacterized protein YbcV (DUF1398 family)